MAACLLLLAGCKHKPTSSDVVPAVDYSAVVVPAFCADSAYALVSAQVAFGPRIPGSKAADGCAVMLASQLRRSCDTVVLQPFTATLWDASRAKGVNIIGSINPQAEKRILLAAHWDSRMWADHDPDEAMQKKPVPGANDGASGSAVLVEMARVMSQMPPSVGVDFILFDLEDQGQPEWVDGYTDNTWCLGSQYWAANPHKPFYAAVYGVLLDMVGTAEGPRFTKEQVSRTYAPGLTDKIWNAAAALGYGSMFVNTKTDPILDDHLYVNQILGVPMVDIVQNSATTSFFTHWHTTTDNLEAISPRTLEAVATVVMKTIYADYPAAQ